MTERKICPSCGKGELVPINDVISEFGGYEFVEKGERSDASPAHTIRFGETDGIEKGDRGYYNKDRQEDCYREGGS